MCKNIKFSRVIINILFFVFYVLLVSIIVSFVFPATLNVFGQEVLNPADPVFDNIQIAIIILVFIFGFIFRKYFYLPISGNKDIYPESKEVKKELEMEHDMNTLKKKEKQKKEKKTEKKGGLDIKTGRESK